MNRRWSGPWLFALAAAIVLSGCLPPSSEPAVAPSSVAPSSARRPASPSPATPSSSAVPSHTAETTETAQTAETLIAAGDIAACDEDGDSSTAALVAGRQGTVATLGDNVYPAGSERTYRECYDPVWGAFLARTRPAIGNHDVQDDGGAAYFEYFGAAAGTPGEGWYSYDLGAWHVVVLNSSCGLVGCDASAQLAWLVDDLAKSEALCTLAYWHHPRFSSGPHRDTAEVAPFWEALERDGAEVVLAGHDHLYERFAPQTSAGVASPEGIRQFTVGTGGKQLYRAERVAPQSEVRIDDAFGVLTMTLRSDGYDWSFLTVDGREADGGSGRCR